MPHAAPPAGHKDVILKDGTGLRLRPLRADDRERMLAFYDRLSPATVYNRFMGFVTRPSFKQAERVAEIDYDDETAIVAVAADDGTAPVPISAPTERVVGVGRYVRMPKPTHAEAAFLVEDAFQGMGEGCVVADARIRVQAIDRFEQFVLSHLEE